MKLTERDLDEMQAARHYIKYLLTKPELKDWEVFDGMMRLDSIGKMLLNRGMNEENQKALDDETKGTGPDLDDMKELAKLFFEMLEKKLDFSIDENET